MQDHVLSLSHSMPAQKCKVIFNGAAMDQTGSNDCQTTEVANPQILPDKIALCGITSGDKTAISAHDWHKNM